MLRLTRLLGVVDRCLSAKGVEAVMGRLRGGISTSSIALASCALILFSFFLVSFSVDDSYIYLRYAVNLKEYGIWNWNPRGLPVEAYTGALYAFLPILPIFLKLPPQLFLDFVGLVFLLALVVRLRQSSSDPFVRGYSVVLLLVAPTAYIHAYSGLETPVFMFLAFELSRVFFKLFNEEDDGFAYFYFLCLAISFVRSDGPVFFGVLFGAILIKRKFRLPDLGYLALFALIGLVYFCWRSIYFGNLLPAPAYHKLGGGGAMFWDNWRSAKIYVLPLIVLLPVWIWQRNRAALMISLACGLVCLMYLRGVLDMNFADRFFYQICIPVLLFLISRIDLRSAGLRNLLTVFAVLLLFNVVGRGFDNQYVKTYTYSLYNSYRVVGDALAKFKGDGYTLLAGDCGILPYQSGWYVYDYMGLANMEVARHGVTREFLERASPDMVIVYSATDGEPGVQALEMASEKMKVILTYMRDSGRYQYVDSFTSGNYFNAMYIKRDLQDAPALTADLKSAAAHTKRMFSGENYFSNARIIKFILAGQWLEL